MIRQQATLPCFEQSSILSHFKRKFEEMNSLIPKDFLELYMLMIITGILKSLPIHFQVRMFTDSTQI